MEIRYRKQLRLSLRRVLKQAWLNVKIKENNEMRSKISGIEFKLNQLTTLKEQREVKEKKKESKKTGKKK